MKYFSNTVQQFTVRQLAALFESKDFVSTGSRMSKEELDAAINSITAGIAPPTFGAMRDATKREGYLKFKSQKAQQLVEAITEISNDESSVLSVLARRKLLTSTFLPVCVVDLDATTEDVVLPLLNLHL